MMQLQQNIPIVKERQIKHLWNLAKYTIYCDPKLSMKYISQIRKITNNNIDLNCICCFKCNLLFVPNYNCTVKVTEQKHSICYECSLCGAKNKAPFDSFPRNKQKQQNVNLSNQKINIGGCGFKNKTSVKTTQQQNLNKNTYQEIYQQKWKIKQHKEHIEKQKKKHEGNIKQPPSKTEENNDVTTFYKFDVEPDPNSSNIKDPYVDIYKKVYEDDKKKKIMEKEKKEKNTNNDITDANKNKLKKNKREVSTVVKNSVPFIKRKKKKKNKNIMDIL